MHLIHKWQKIYETSEYQFRGRTLKRKWCRYRRCLTCGKIQEFEWDSQGGSWRTLKADEVNAVREDQDKGILSYDDSLPTPTEQDEITAEQ